MKVAQLSLPLSAILVIGMNQSALAGPQSLLDPYSHVRPPSKKSATAARKPSAPVRPAAPSSVVISGPDLPPLPKEKKVKAVAPPVPASKPAPTPVVTKSPEAAVDSALAGESPSNGTADGGEGFIAGTKQMFRGFTTATKGAVITPTRAMFSGTKKMADGTKSLGGKVADGTKSIGGKVGDGAKSGGGFFVKGFSAVGGGFKAVGEKLKDGTVAVGEKVGGGLKVAAEKTKDGAGAVAAAPKALAGGGKKDVPTPPAVAAVDKKVATAGKELGGEITPPAPEPITNDPQPGESLGGKVLAMPKTAGKAVVGAAAKTGEVTKKMVTAPAGLFGKLNPFKKDAPPAVQTAGSPKAGMPGAH